MSYRIIWEKKGVVQKFSGSIRPDQMMQCNHDIYGDSRFDDLRYQLLDLIDVTQVNIGDEEHAVQIVEQVAAQDRAAAKTNPRVRVAVAVKIEELSTLASLYSSELTPSPWRSEVFETEQAARTWVINY